LNIKIFLTTRYGSTRFKQKHLKEIGGKSVTDILINRLKKTGIDIIMVTPNTKNDIKYMHQIAKSNDIMYFAGDINNIIQRHIDCASTNDVDWIINVDGDDILTCSDLIKIINSQILSGTTATDCIHLTGYPLGMNLIAYTPERLKKVKYNRDTNWGKMVLEAGDVCEIKSEVYNDFRVTLDYIEDLITINHLLFSLGHNCNSDEICSFMKDHPEIRAINYFKNIEYFERLEDLSK
jgi:spore coat polysaccharide biosynthesis protein SpsF (cytidylyltransferase family)